jgi:antibiotic biosynthesis monooxygenase (ABM) superfamily enzyme
MEWQRGVTAAAAQFPGYNGTDLYPATLGHGDEWVVVIHFDDDKSLQNWLNSSVRAEWVEKLKSQVGEFELRAIPGGFGPWFAGLARGPEEVPPGWKMVLTVVLCLFPTVMLLSLFPGPYINPLGLAVSMLIGNVLSVSILQWFVTPVVTKLLAWWLKANTEKDLSVTIAGVVLVLVLLAILCFLFRLITG